MSQLSQTFLALLKEGQFTKDLLGAGVTQIRRANYASKGTYFQAFSSLSTGLERIGKIALIVDHYIDNSGRFPDFNYLKNEIGHDLVKLQEKALAVVQRRGLAIAFPSSSIHASIVQLLGDFAKGDRYSNLNLLVGSARQSDPIAAWFKEVDLALYDSQVRQFKKEKIARNAQISAHMMRSFTRVMHTSETGTEISDVEEASFRTGVFEAVAPYRQLYILQIIRFWVELLRLLQYAAHDRGSQDIPYFGELFAAFGNDDSYLRTRKTWDNV